MSAIVNQNLVKNVVRAATFTKEDAVVTSLTVTLADKRSFVVVSTHAKEADGTKTTRQFIGLPADVDANIKTQLLWDAPVVATEVVKLFIRGEVAVFSESFVH